MIKAVVFDFDETLVKNTEFIKEHLIRVIERYPITKKLSNKERIRWEANIRELTDVNTNFVKMFDILFGEDVGKDYLENYREDSQEYDYKPVNGALEFVEELNRKGIKMFILSNRTKILPLRASQAGFNTDDFEIYSAPDGFSKPHPLSYKPVLERIEEEGFENEEVLFLGNNLIDYKGLPEEWRDRFRALPYTEIQRRAFLKEGLQEEMIFDSYSELREFLKPELRNEISNIS